MCLHARFQKHHLHRIKQVFSWRDQIPTQAAFFPGHRPLFFSTVCHPNPRCRHADPIVHHLHLHWYPLSSSIHHLHIILTFSCYHHIPSKTSLLVPARRLKRVAIWCHQTPRCHVVHLSYCILRIVRPYFPKD